MTQLLGSQWRIKDEQKILILDQSSRNIRPEMLLESKQDKLMK